MNNINLIGSKNIRPEGYPGVIVNPSSDPSGLSGQLHIHDHARGRTYSIYEGGQAISRLTAPRPDGIYQPPK
jgi:hypothetical protein